MQELSYKIRLYEKREIKTTSAEKIGVFWSEQFFKKNQKRLKIKSIFGGFFDCWGKSKRDYFYGVFKGLGRTGLF